MERDVQTVIHPIKTEYIVLHYPEPILLLDKHFNIQALPFFRKDVNAGPLRIEKDDSFRSLEIVRIIGKRIFMIERCALI
jgi:hypothetical protein